jgi:serine/threonine protein kinase
LLAGVLEEYPLQDKDDVRQELAIMHHLSGHPNVVTFENAFEDDCNIHIVMELCTGGELFDRIVSRGHYSEKSASLIIREILEVVAHCHAMGVVHRDLKPENFMLSNTGSAAELKTIDFGLSAFFLPDHLLSDIVGSAYYVAPEVLKRSYSYQWFVPCICHAGVARIKNNRMLFCLVTSGVVESFSTSCFAAFLHSLLRTRQPSSDK